MLKRVLILAIVAGTLTFAGCDKKGDGSSPDQVAPSPAPVVPSPGRVAVVDMDKIIEDIGYKSKLEEARKVRDNNLLLSVRDVQQKWQAQLISLNNEIGERPKVVVPTTPTEAEKKAIQEWVAKKQNLERTRLDATNKLRQDYNQQRQANQQAIRAQFSEIAKRVKPIAKRIAKDKGLDIVVTSSSVFVFDDAVDITDAVFKEVNKLLMAGEFPAVIIPKAYQVSSVPPTSQAAPKTPAPKIP